MLVGWCVGNGINDVPKLRHNNNIFYVFPEIH